MDLVGQRLDRGDHDRIAGVDAERVDVLHRADRDARVVGIAHDLVLDLLPADQAALDHHLVDRAGAQAGADPLPVGRFRLHDPAAGAAQRERRPDDGRQPDLLERPVRGLLTLRGRQPLDDRARRVRLVDPIEQVAERLAVLGHPDRLEWRPEQADVVAFEHARLGEGRGQVEGRLSAEAGKEAFGLLARNDGLDGFDRQRFEIDRVGDLRVGHDRGRVAVDQDRPDPLAAERAAGLRAGVVELGRLADDDRPRPEDQDRGGLRSGRVQASPRGGLASEIGRLRNSLRSPPSFRIRIPKSDGGRWGVSRAGPSEIGSGGAAAGMIMPVPGTRRGSGRTPPARRAAPARPRGGTGRSRSASLRGAGPRRSRRSG